MIPINVFKTSFSVPRTVYILGSGPNGVEHYDDIPRDAYVIALNKAVLALLPRLPDVWLCHARLYWRWKHPWWETAMKLDTIRIFGARLAQDVPDCHFTYTHWPAWAAEPREILIDEVLRTGGTVAGCAVQLAYYHGASKVIICGVDMYGDTYFDGSQHADAKHKRDKVWTDADGDCTKDLGSIVKACTRRPSFAVTSLSRTALDVPMEEKRLCHLV